MDYARLYFSRDSSRTYFEILNAKELNHELLMKLNTFANNRGGYFDYSTSQIAINRVWNEQTAKQVFDSLDISVYFEKEPERVALFKHKVLFGKYSGFTWEQVPVGYLKYMLNSLPEQSKNWNLVYAEIKRRDFDPTFNQEEVISFGKYRGERWVDLSENYLMWLKDSLDDDNIHKKMAENTLKFLSRTQILEETPETALNNQSFSKENLEEEIPSSLYKTPIQEGVFSVERFDRMEVHMDKNSIYVFGDNTDDRVYTKYIPSSTQAVVRGLSNTLGIDTKRDRDVVKTSYFTDKHIDIYQRYIDKVINKLQEYRAEGRDIIFPKNGIGTGKAKMSQKAPMLFDYLSRRLYKEFGFLNQGYHAEDDTLKGEVMEKRAYLHEKAKLLGIDPNELRVKLQPTHQGMEIQPLYKNITILSIDINGTDYIKVVDEDDLPLEKEMREIQAMIDALPYIAKELTDKKEETATEAKKEPFKAVRKKR